MDTAEIITAIIVARRVESDKVAPIFQKDGSRTTNKIRKIGRVERMIRMR